MKKIYIIEVFLITFFLAILWSCHNEDLQTDNSTVSKPNDVFYDMSKNFLSKSLWKEDDLYIGKVQQVFLKVANIEYIRNNYGELYWDYTMTFGQFGETYLLVPIVKNNRVVLLMEAVREKDKVYFYQKEDKGLIVFFQAIIFDKITDFNEKISIQERREERTIGNVNVGCTTRSITVGCNDNEPNCVPYTRTETICPPKYGNNPPKAFDPIGLDGGGGGDGYNYPDPPENETPCEKAKKIGNNAKTQDLFEGLKTKTNSTKEFGQVLKESAGQINNTQVEGEANQAGIDFNVSGKFDGFIHSHYSGLLSIFSANDLASLAAIYINGGMSNVNNFIFGVVTASGTQYILIIDDPEKFAIFAKQFLLPNGQIDQVYTDSYGNGIYIMYNIKNNGLSSANELGFVKLLSNENTGLKVFKGSNNSTNWAELGLKNGQLDSKPCNN